MHRLLVGILGSGALLAGSFTPFIPNGAMTFAYAYETPCVLTQPPVAAPPAATSSTVYLPTDFTPEYVPSCKSGTTDVAVFVDDTGQKHYVEIPKAQYVQMGRKDGGAQNPSKDQYDSIMQVLTSTGTAQAAVAQVVSASAISASNALSITVPINGTGSSLFGIVFVGDDDNDTVSGVTWGGTSMTQLRKVGRGGGSTVPMAYAYSLANPPAGSQNIVATRTGIFHKIGAVGILLSGAVQTTSPVDATNIASASPGGATLAVTVTTVADQAAVYVFGGGDNGLGATPCSTGLNSTAVATMAMDATGFAACKSSTFPFTPAGAFSGTLSLVSSGAPMGIVLSIAPLSTPAGFGPWQLFEF